MENQELQIIEQPELTAIVQKSNIELTKAQEHALAFAPLMQQYHELALVLGSLDKVNPTASDAKIARDSRLKMVKIRTGADTIKDDRKAILLIESSLIQDLRNVVANTCALTESEFMAIEKHRERVEAERVEKLAESRRLQLSEFGEVNPFVDLKAMDDETFGKFLENEKLAFTARKEAAEKAEQDRIAAEKKAEEERLAKIEAERLEQERIKAENEKLRLENEAKEKELAAERKKQAEEKAESERLAKIESDKQAKIQAEKDKKAADELAEQKRLSELKDKRAKEMSPFIRYIRDYDKLINSSESAYQKELDDMTKAFLAEQKYEADKLAEAKKIQDAKEAEIAKYKAELDAEKQRKEKELADEKERIEAEESEKLAREKATLLAPDKDKINSLFVAIKDFKFPELQTPEANAILNDVKEGFQIIMQGIKDKAKTLK